ncbi:MAG TPA: peptidoglycan-binding LysM, partial [Clostridiaceae bacterium]|nr:peptidoglycan-binding LysM [Clostridiaceae bacterium]
MALELINDTLKFDQVIGEGQSQALVDKDMNVPDIKPDIAKILSVEGKANITGKEVEQDRIAVDGTVDFSILYSTSDEPQPIYSIAHSDNFSQYIEI